MSFHYIDRSGPAPVFIRQSHQIADLEPMDEADWEAEKAETVAAASLAYEIARRPDTIKAACRDRIYAVASREAQMNMGALATVIGARPAADRTPAEQATLAAYEASLGWVQAMRAAAAGLIADAAADHRDDDAWPACPAAVAALAAQF